MKRIPRFRQKKDRYGNILYVAEQKHKENFDDQGCEHWWFGDYIEDSQGFYTVNDSAKIWAELSTRANILECELNNARLGRYNAEGVLDSNCNSDGSLTVSAPPTIRCIRRKGKGPDSNKEKDVEHYLNLYGPDAQDALRTKIRRLEEDLAYELAQNQNLVTQREDKGIEQRDLYVLYPEMKDVVDEFGEGTELQNQLDNDLGGGDKKRNWIIFGVGLLVLGIGGFVATKKLGE
jgi:hypothetical protein